MKKIILYTVPAALLAILTSAAVWPASKAAPYEREQIKGNVRVVLIEVKRSTVFTAQKIKDAVPGKVYPVSSIGATYLVEALGDEPIKIWNTGSTNIPFLIGNRSVESFNPMPENIGQFSGSGMGPASQSDIEGTELPKPMNKNRTYIYSESERVGPYPAGTMNLTLKVGFNETSETFVFSNVPVN